MIEDVLAQGKLRWKNRRAMAWAALVTTLAYPALVLFTDLETHQSVLSLAAFYFPFTGTVVVSYIGGQVVDNQLQEWRGTKEKNIEGNHP